MLKMTSNLLRPRAGVILSRYSANRVGRKPWTKDIGSLWEPSYVAIALRKTLYSFRRYELSSRGDGFLKPNTRSFIWPLHTIRPIDSAQMSTHQKLLALYPTLWIKFFDTRDETLYVRVAPEVVGAICQRPPSILVVL